MLTEEVDAKLITRASVARPLRLRVTPGRVRRTGSCAGCGTSSRLSLGSKPRQTVCLSREQAMACSMSVECPLMA